MNTSKCLSIRLPIKNRSRLYAIMSFIYNENICRNITYIFKIIV